MFLFESGFLPEPLRDCRDVFLRSGSRDLRFDSAYDVDDAPIAVLKVRVGHQGPPHVVGQGEPHAFRHHAG
jgi:hypothetical protein